MDENMFIPVNVNYGVSGGGRTLSPNTDIRTSSHETTNEEPMKSQAEKLRMS